MRTQRHTQARMISAGLLAVCGVLVMTGCANPIEQLISKGAETALEKAIEQGGGAVDLDISNDGGLSFTTEEGGSVDFGSNASVPADWPGLPLPDGEVLSSIKQDGTFALTIRSSTAAAESLLAELTSSGFTETGSSDMGVMKTYTLEGTEWNITLGWLIDEDTNEASIQYMLHPVS